MRYLARSLGVFLGIFILAIVPAARCDESPDQLFNGKDLDGFDGFIKEYWTFKDGALVGNTAPDGLKFNTFLCSKKKYKDFELSFQVRLKEGKGNSGVQIRSAILKAEEFSVKGPQADMGTPYWGSLYGEKFGGVKPEKPGGMMKQAPAEVVEKVLKKDDFNDYFIRCVGKHVTIKLNGETTVDDDFPQMPEEGIIAFQLHKGPAMEATFRKIEFKKLPGK